MPFIDGATFCGRHSPSESLPLSRSLVLLPLLPPPPGAGEEMRSPCSFKFNVTVSERADDESPIIGSVYLPLNVSL